MAIDSATLQRVTAQLYERSLKKIPDDTRAALARAETAETDVTGKRMLKIMMQSADAAPQDNDLVRSDDGIPFYSIKIGTRVHYEGPVRAATPRGFAELVQPIDPPILKMLT